MKKIKTEVCEPNYFEEEQKRKNELIELARTDPKAFIRVAIAKQIVNGNLLFILDRIDRELYQFLIEKFIELTKEK